MSDNRELLRDYDKWKNSLRNFEWLTSTVPGATDIDVFIERKGNFLVLETKEWQNKRGITIPFGQYLALTALANIPQFTVILIGETKDPDVLYWLDVAQVTGIKRKTSPVLYRAADFTRTDREGLLESVAHWYSSASAPK